MFSQLGPLFRTTFRQAEPADARLEIRREEKEDGRKKQEETAEDDNTSSLWEDSTSVSIESLRTFLFQFLKGHGAEVPAEASAAIDVTAPALIEERSPVSTTAARAAKAYGSMAAHVQPRPSFSGSPPPTETTPIDLASLLEADEIRAIHALIAELDALSKTGLQSLSFQMNGTFLQSLAEAVRLAKAGSNP